MDRRWALFALMSFGVIACGDTAVTMLADAMTDAAVVMRDAATDDAVAMDDSSSLSDGPSSDATPPTTVLERTCDQTYQSRQISRNSEGETLTTTESTYYYATFEASPGAVYVANGCGRRIVGNNPWACNASGNPNIICEGDEQPFAMAQDCTGVSIRVRGAIVEVDCGYTTRTTSEATGDVSEYGVRFATVTLATLD